MNFWEHGRLAICMITILFLLIACGGEDQDPAPTETAVPATNTEAADGETLLALPSLPGEVYYAPFPVEINLDGDLTDWNNVPRVFMPESAAEVQGATSITFAAAADEELLYFMADVTDPNIISGEHGTNYWNEDSVEFYINASDNLNLTEYAEGVAQINIPPFNAGRPIEEVVLGGIQGETAEAQVQVVLSEKGYIVETAVPLTNSVWDIQLQHGNVIGFQAHLNGASTTDRNLKVIWSLLDTADTSYLDPSVFGQLVFFEVGQTDVVAQLPEPAVLPTRIPVPADAPYKNPELPIDARVEDLLARMSLEDKIGQMTLIEKNSIQPSKVTELGIGGILSGGGGYPEGINSPESWADMVDGFQAAALDSHLGIPIIYGVDAVHGHSNVEGTVIFPHNIGLGAANNPELMTEIGRITALEMIATGIYWNYAPAVSVPQDIRWGRTYEGYSENPELVTSLAVAYLQGLQEDDLSAPDTVLATPKHFVGDGGAVWGTSTTDTYNIDQGVTDVDEEVLRTIHLPPYPAVIEAGASNIMISYSSWGGMKMHAQQYLIGDVLRGELGFDGFIVSDWAGVDQITDDYYEAVVIAINAGVDMNMVPYDYNRFIKTMEEAVEAGDISMERIDEAVGNILTVKFELGLFENPYSDATLLAEVGSEAHRAVAREAVAQSQVLLKNEGGLLPLSADLPTLYVGGQAANDIGIQSGGWTIEWQGKEGASTIGTTILQGIEATVSADTAVIYDEFGRFDDLPVGEEIVCVGVVGERPYAEGRGDSADLRLPVGDLRVLNRMEETCDQLVIILISGRPLIIADHIDSWDALVAAWLPGTEGQGVADVLFGERPFSGTLPYTWPLTIEQLPFDFANLDENEPLFPFGYGLTGE
ncbi:glycoside hydrolase family 3 N-terminal domain-containing protein [Candidatus Leptofilum sp.]|uniref:glycoside hydrolase family 3 N-terminal domain-containing protein n=1 Tax=Candidatus Leptofilum sp. TaxID=3241576 RepID=UPI003B5C1EBD